MKRIIPIVSLAILLVAACSTEAVYKTKDVNLNMEIRQRRLLRGIFPNGQGCIFLHCRGEGA